MLVILRKGVWLIKQLFKKRLGSGSGSNSLPVRPKARLSGRGINTALDRGPTPPAIRYRHPVETRSGEGKNAGGVAVVLADLVAIDAVNDNHPLKEYPTRNGNLQHPSIHQKRNRQ